MQSETNHYEILVIWTFFFYLFLHGHKKMAVGQITRGQLSSLKSVDLMTYRLFSFIGIYKTGDLEFTEIVNLNPKWWLGYFPEDVFLERKLSIKPRIYAYGNCDFYFHSYDWNPCAKP